MKRSLLVDDPPCASPGIIASSFVFLSGKQAGPRGSGFLTGLLI